MSLDLTPFGFTPTESLVYQVLVTGGPGTGYAVARAAGLARANAYAALEGLTAKGAARVENGRPRRYRPEPPSLLLARIVDAQARAVDELSDALGRITVPVSDTITEIGSARGVSRMLGLEVARARAAATLLLPAASYPALVPALRRALAIPVQLELYADGAVQQSTVPVIEVSIGDRWPGRPLLGAIDDRIALLGTAQGEKVTGVWGTSPALVAAARHTIASLTTPA